MSQTVTVVRVDTGQPFIARAEFVKNADGSVSFGIDSGWAGRLGQFRRVAGNLRRTNAVGSRPSFTVWCPVS